MPLEGPADIGTACFKLTVHCVAVNEDRNLSSDEREPQQSRGLDSIVSAGRLRARDHTHSAIGLREIVNNLTGLVPAQCAPAATAQACTTP